MTAPKNIYIVQWPSRQSPGGKWHTEIPVIPHPEWIYQYICHDIHAAVVAESDELRRQRDLLAESLAECHQYMKDEETPAQCIKRNRDDMTGLLSLLADERRTVEQLRARLDAAMEWVPVAEADLRDGEKCSVFLPCNDEIVTDVTFDSEFAVFSTEEGCEIDIQEVTHIMRIKPPAGAE